MVYKLAASIRESRRAEGDEDGGPKVVSLNPQSLEDVIADCIVVGDAVGMPDEGRAAAAALTERLKAAKALARGLGTPRLGRVSPAQPGTSGNITSRRKTTYPCTLDRHQSSSLAHSLTF